MQRLARAAALAGLVFLLLIGVLLAVLPSPGVDRAASALSTKPAGLRAAFLLLERLGFEVAAWSDAPGELGGGDLLLLSRVPEAPARGPEPAPPDGRAGRPATRGRDPAHYRRFVEQGGTLLALGGEQEQLEFLRDTLGLDGFELWSFEDIAAGAVVADPAGRELRLASGERIRLSRDVRRCLVAPLEGSEVLVRVHEDGELGPVLAQARAVGRGRVVLLSLPLESFDNEALQEDGDNAYFLARFLAELEPFERVLFDEYALGGFGPPSAVSLAFSPLAALLSAHFLVLCLLLTWRSAWVGPFARDPEPLGAAAALTRARGLGRTLAAAGRWQLLARLLLRGTLERWCARAGLRAPSTGEGARLDAGAVEACLGALARGDRRRLARARKAFLEHGVDAEAGLERLDAELAGLEREMFEREGGRGS